ncbi:uncharacterized protein LOC114180539 [Vigna unguiculata]|uniref:uncharacterized protein LOC114180539 n=1 Tax=Vigna unguiculata TaxID=3917 RepID=UPI0010165A38|nr:uncharacterized protein LOC114180539 [Vigna unguiculata]
MHIIPFPRVASNPSTPTTNVAPSTSTHIPGTHSSSAINDMDAVNDINVEEESNNRPMIRPVGGGFYPSKVASKAITATIKQQFDQPWLTWGTIPKSERGLYFQRFKRKVSWRVEDEDRILKNFHSKASHRLSEMFKEARREGKRPNWIGDSIWNSLLEKWNMPMYREKCDTAKKNRLSEKGGSLHTGDLSACMTMLFTEELGRAVHVDEIFEQTHIRKATGDFVDERSRRTHEEFQNRFSQALSETASVGVSQSTPMDPAEEERLRNRCWLEAAGGSYIQQTQASSSQQVNPEQIIQLQTRLATSEERIRQMSSQFQTQFDTIQNFIGAIIQYLPPPAAAVAQTIFQQPNTEQGNQAEQENQVQHQQVEQDHEEAPTSPRPYRDY